MRFHTVGLPQGNSSVVKNGSTDVICMQSYPMWIIELTAQSNNVSTEVMEQIMLSQAGQTEACLVLDIHVPANIFKKNTTESGAYFSIPMDSVRSPSLHS